MTSRRFLGLSDRDTLVVVSPALFINDLQRDITRKKLQKHILCVRYYYNTSVQQVQSDSQHHWVGTVMCLQTDASQKYTKIKPIAVDDAHFATPNYNFNVFVCTFDIIISRLL